jgi:predicted transcriptional regulator
MIRTEMTDQIRKLVIVEMAKRDLKQKDLAEKVGRSPQQLHNILRRNSGDMPDGSFAFSTKRETKSSSRWLPRRALAVGSCVEGVGEVEGRLL